jgi:predicted AAA+ superfamily ATPase
MDYIGRILQIKKLVKNKSLFLMGPRQTGKSSLLKKVFSDSYKIDLLRNDEFLRYQKDPGLLIREFESKKKTELILIDEIQRLPDLLNDVHYLIEQTNHHFLMTGSSARKMKKVGTNLLGGRAGRIIMHPFIRAELNAKFSLNKALSFGLLPSVYFNENPKNKLNDYVGLYLKEEILSEGLTRNLPAFSRFLESAAAMNGKMINYTKIANDAQIPPSSAYEHFKVLEDTLIAKEVISFNKTNIRKAISTSKFYFFDIGVVRSILGRGQITSSDADYGDTFEAYIFQELSAYTSYNQLSDIKYWRSKSNYEVDFIFDNRIAIEVKTTKKVNSSDLKGLKALAEEKLLKKYILISFDKKNQFFEGVDCLYWEDFLDQLSAGGFDQ